jgi:competence protein ComEA
MFKHILAALLAFAAATAFAAVDINKANLAELEAVKGVGTVTAGKILDERQKGSFKDWRDVQSRIKGIKDAKAGKLSAAGLTVNGDTFTPGPVPAKATKVPKQGKRANAAAAKTPDAKSSKN